MGKTLAFLLPVMERLRCSKDRDSKITPPSPRMLILAPTKELAN